MEEKLPEPTRSLATGLHSAADAFVEAGLGHVSCERGMTTLSEGESRRSRLAALLQTRGEGLALLLDEPARGLHEEDVRQLSLALDKLKRRHTLIINEHRVSLANVADQLLEIGPGAGQSGGQVVYQGPPKLLTQTASWKAAARAHLTVDQACNRLTVAGAWLHTLSNVACSIPLGRLVSVTGVSGSGKSSFVRGILLPALQKELPGRTECEGFAWAGGTWDSVEGYSNISSVSSTRTAHIQHPASKHGGNAPWASRRYAQDIRPFSRSGTSASQAHGFRLERWPRPLSKLFRIGRDRR